MKHINKIIFTVVIITVLLILFLCEIYENEKNNKCSNLKCPDTKCPNAECPKCYLTVDEKNKILNKRNDQKQTIYTTIVKKTKSALDKLNIPMFLSSGTCLGYFREKKFIDHDYDIDVGIFSKDYTPEIIENMTNEGLIHYRTLGDLDTGMELSFRLPNTAIGRIAKIDIFLHYPGKGKNKNKISWFSYAAPEFKKKIEYRVSKFKLEEVDFMGLKVNVPSPTLKYIEEHYGKEWETPKKAGVNYSYSRSPVSIVQNED